MITYREPLSDNFFTLPTALFCFAEESHVAMREMRPVMCVEYEEARLWLLQ